MSTEETELTFIRCPNCRSLVPAVATRCRMCGQLIEQSAESPPSNNQPSALDSLAKKSRVRQRTMSVSDEEVQSAKEGAWTEPAESEKPVRASSAASETSQPEQRIPESDTRNESETEASRYHLWDRKREDDRPSPLFSRAVDAPTQDTAQPEKEEDQVVFSRNTVNFPEYTDELSDDEGEDDLGEDEADELSTETRQGLFGPRPSGEGEQPGADPHGGDLPGADSLGGERRKRRRRRRRRRGGARTEGEQVSTPNTAQNFDASPISEEGTEDDFQPAPNFEPPRKDYEQPRKEQFAKTAQFNSEEVRKTDMATAAGNISVAPSQEEQDGVLIGWFVDYAHGPKGNAREVRAGKFFIGAEQLRGSDLVIRDQSVSTPHCLVKATAQGIQFQDLMSERGTFVRRHSENSYQRSTETFTVQSGDWIRFGNYEMMICLIPPRRK